MPNLPFMLKELSMATKWKQDHLIHWSPNSDATQPVYRVEVPITDHLRNSAPKLEKHKAVQFIPVSEDRTQEDCKFFGKFIP